MEHPIIAPSCWETYGISQKDVGLSTTINYQCGYCENMVGSQRGMVAMGYSIYAVICPTCGCMSMVGVDGYQVPGESYGNPVDNLPDDVKYLYDEARECYKAEAYTGVILIARKCLANVAINLGAEDGNSFVSYVDFLSKNGYIAEKSKKWVDEIRKEGNSATHNKASKNKHDANKILRFLEMLLLINYEFNDLEVE
ncbi:Uncharacterised protein [Enterococcus saccharolyticus]|uniref:DUF4145 domain-containing protein n=1 Tax=Enterococcus TaxID=1350 RepID=UPI001027915E|nr:DUF4145 domain-containing protein [Enterococcus saccharolyticus]VFA67112.1 Uncharacterised protein [Enterococcus saccharolyticus]